MSPDCSAPAFLVVEAGNTPRTIMCTRQVARVRPFPRSTLVPFVRCFSATVFSSLTANYLRQRMRCREVCVGEAFALFINALSCNRDLLGVIASDLHCCGKRIRDEDVRSALVFHSTHEGLYGVVRDESQETHETFVELCHAVLCCDLSWSRESRALLVIITACILLLCRRFGPRFTVLRIPLALFPPSNIERISVAGNALFHPRPQSGCLHGLRDVNVFLRALHYPHLSALPLPLLTAFANRFCLTIPQTVSLLRSAPFVVSTDLLHRQLQSHDFSELDAFSCCVLVEACLKVGLVPPPPLASRVASLVGEYACSSPLLSRLAASFFVILLRHNERALEALSHWEHLSTLVEALPAQTDKRVVHALFHLMHPNDVTPSIACWFARQLPEERSLEAVFCTHQHWMREEATYVMLVSASVASCDIPAAKHLLCHCDPESLSDKSLAEILEAAKDKTLVKEELAPFVHEACKRLHETIDMRERMQLLSAFVAHATTQQLSALAAKTARFPNPTALYQAVSRGPSTTVFSDFLLQRLLKPSPRQNLWSFYSFAVLLLEGEVTVEPFEGLASNLLLSFNWWKALCGRPKKAAAVAYLLATCGDSLTQHNRVFVEHACGLITRIPTVNLLACAKHRVSNSAVEGRMWLEAVFSRSLEFKELSGLNIVGILESFCSVHCDVESAGVTLRCCECAIERILGVENLAIVTRQSVEVYADIVWCTAKAYAVVKNANVTLAAYVRLMSHALATYLEHSSDSRMLANNGFENIKVYNKLCEASVWLDGLCPTLHEWFE